MLPYCLLPARLGYSCQGKPPPQDLSKAGWLSTAALEYPRSFPFWCGWDLCNMRPCCTINARRTQQQRPKRPEQRPHRCAAAAAAV
mmetsp:Transcript_25339/g.74852  ORF Transcript_25339/g.74852 Transcript_25339/m.74852 type:complete len:86 (+) Transcript_25339:404-661(+)